MSKPILLPKLGKKLDQALPLLSSLAAAVARFETIHGSGLAPFKATHLSSHSRSTYPSCHWGCRCLVWIIIPNFY